jgi:hypothetical protein
MAISDEPTIRIKVIRNENVDDRFCLKFGRNYLFVSGAKLMISGGVPAHKNDGAVVGSQS